MRLTTVILATMAVLAGCIAPASSEQATASATDEVAPALQDIMLNIPAGDHSLVLDLSQVPETGVELRIEHDRPEGQAVITMSAFERDGDELTWAISLLSHPRGDGSGGLNLDEGDYVVLVAIHADVPWSMRVTHDTGTLRVISQGDALVSAYFDADLLGPPPERVSMNVGFDVNDARVRTPTGAAVGSLAARAEHDRRGESVTLAFPIVPPIGAGLVELAFSVYEIQDTRTYPIAGLTSASGLAIAQGEGPTSVSLKTTEASVLSWAAADLITVPFDTKDTGLHVVPLYPSGGAQIQLMGDASCYRISDDIACARD